MKYIFRAGRKPGVKRSQDLRKAEHCLREAAERAEKMESLEPTSTPVPVPAPLEKRLYPCPNGHYVPAAAGAPSRFKWHTTAGQHQGNFGTAGQRCEFSGAYVPIPEEEIRRMADGE